MLGCRHIPVEEYSFHGFPAIRRASCCTYIGETHCQTIGGKRIDQVVTVFLEVVRPREAERLHAERLVLPSSSSATLRSQWWWWSA